MELNFSNVPVIHSDNSIFLAGPTYRDADFSASWRNNAISILNDEGFSGVVYIPEYPVGVDFTDDMIEKQTYWEWEALDNAGVILFWIPRSERLPGFTTNVEFGIYTTKRPQNVILGYPQNANKMRYIDILYRKKAGRVPDLTLEATIKHCLMLLKAKNSQEGSFI